MRRAKDNRQLPKWYCRPEQTVCPHCGQTLKRAYVLWRKAIVFLSGRCWIENWAYRCSNSDCPEPTQVYTSQMAKSLTLHGSSFALEVIVQIGYWRFWKRWTVTQIHEVLTQERHLPISEREVLYLIGVFLVLGRCTYHLRLAEHAAYFQRHGIFLSIDALKPEKGNTALYVVRELTLGLVLQVKPLLSANQLALEQKVLQPVNAFGYRVRGVVSDDELALRLAVAQVWPTAAHQTCQLHCLQDAATPVEEADQCFKKALKRAFRAPFYTVARAVDQLSTDDPHHLALDLYAELIRSTLTEGNKPPFALGGVRVFEELAHLENSLQRSLKKGGIRSWNNCWPWCNSAERLPSPIGDSNDNSSGWWNWIDFSIHRNPMATPAPRAVQSNAKSSSFCPTWSNPHSTHPKTPRWWRISVPPFANAGHASSPAMRGPNATAPTTPWKLSSGASAPASDKFMGASPSTSLSCAMANGWSLSIPPRPSRKSYIGSSCLTKLRLIKSSPAFKKPKNGSGGCIDFAITPAVV
jgi:Transposase, Mutator family